MSQQRRNLGALGEKLAAKHLRKKGYTIIEQNYRCRLGEIDIVARDGTTLVFVEVKTRTSTTFGTPAMAVTPKKQQQISRAAQQYLASHDLFDSAARFDVVAVFLPPNGAREIEIVPNAFDLIA